MSTNYSTGEVLDVIHTALAEMGFTLRKDAYEGTGWNIYNKHDRHFLIRENDAVTVHNANELLTALGGEIGRYGDNEILQPLRDEELLNETLVSLEESGYPEKAYASICEWENSDNPSEQDFYDEHKNACALFDLIVNQPDSLKDPTLLADLYEMSIPHIMEYKTREDAATEVGDIIGAISDCGYTVVPNGDGYSVTDGTHGICSPVFYSTEQIMMWLDVNRHLLAEINLNVGMRILDKHDAIALVEDLAERNDELFEKTVRAAARLDTIDRYGASIELQQLAVLNAPVTVLKTPEKEFVDLLKQFHFELEKIDNGELALSDKETGEVYSALCTDRDYDEEVIFSLCDQFTTNYLDEVVSICGASEYLREDQTLHSTDEALALRAMLKAHEKDDPEARRMLDALGKTFSDIQFLQSSFVETLEFDKVYEAAHGNNTKTKEHKNVERD